ncbi:hypothetical protein [Rhodobacter ferrooxidans]|uniref:hypothetical protein n=1 Tax=Rhodobacter ferrooxidans TaxID=371731 RepID=UPI001E3C2DA8|nr:hypothetical protein [Rhodobacter sp. SW2]
MKLLVKHGWPAKADSVGSFSFCIVHHEKGEDAPDDFWAAVSIAVRIVARTYNVQVSEISGFVQFERSYIVTAGGHFKEANHVLPRESAP